MFQTCTLSEKAYWLKEFLQDQYQADVNNKSQTCGQVPNAVWDAVKNLFIDFYI